MSVASLTRLATRGYSRNNFYPVVAKGFGTFDTLPVTSCIRMDNQYRSHSYPLHQRRRIHQRIIRNACCTNFDRRRRTFLSAHHLHGAESNLVLGVYSTSIRQKSGSKPSQDDDLIDEKKQTMADAVKETSDYEEGTTQTRDSQMTSILKQMRSIPNIITATRIASTPVISYLVLTEQYKYAVAGCVVFGLTDWLDGYIARNYEGQMTVLGTYLDPLADKIMVNVLSLSLCYNGILPGPIVTLWLARDVGLVVATYLSAALVTKSGDAVADPARTALKVEPTTISKVNTILQFMTVSGGMLQPICGLISPDVVLGLCWITAGTTVASALSYVGGKSLIESGNALRRKRKGRKL